MLFLAVTIWPRDRFWDLLFTRAAWGYCELLPLRQSFRVFPRFLWTFRDKIELTYTITHQENESFGK